MFTMSFKLSIEQPILTFKTSKGSQYWLDEYGRSQRFKSYHPNHGVDNQGIREPYNHVIFVSNEHAHTLDLAADYKGKWWMIIRKSTICIVAYDSEKQLRMIAGPFDFSFEPKLKLAPIEIKNLIYADSIQGYYVQGYFHIGNEIVELEYFYS